MWLTGKRLSIARLLCVVCLNTL